MAGFLPGGCGEHRDRRGDHRSKAAGVVFYSDRAKLGGLGRSGPSVQQVVSTLCRRPLNSIGQLSAACDQSFPTTSKAVEIHLNLGIAPEITGDRRNRPFAYEAYLAILSEGAEPL